jgi:NB-ARC domain
MGGVGKTELATQYVRRHEVDYSGGICWLTSRESDLANELVQFFLLHMDQKVLEKFKQIRTEQDLKQQLEWCWQHWKPSEGLVLVVLDDVTDLGSCRGMLPTGNRFRVLMTTRLRRLDTNFFDLPLDVLSPQKALEFLADLESEERVKCEYQIAEELCEWLGYLPLGLELVGRYLAEDPDLSLAEMLERLKALRLQDEALDLSEQQMQQTFSTARRGVRAAFELSWRDLNPISQRIGQLLSLFKPTVIPWELVTFSSETQSLSWTPKEINSAKNQLYNLSLIQRIEDKKYYYKIHPLLRDFFQAKLAVSELASKITETFSAAIEAFYNKLANDILEPNINNIEDQVAEDFEQRDFEEDWNPEDGFTLPLEDITVTIDSVKTTQKKLLDVGNNLFKFELIVEIDFTVEGSSPDIDLSYYDSEEGEVVFLNHITEVEDKNTATIPVKVEIVFDENDPDINEVEFVVNEPIKFNRQPIEVYSNWDEFSSDWEE